MAKVRLQQVRHSYNPDIGDKTEYALQHIDLTWDNGGACPIGALWMRENHSS